MMNNLLSNKEKFFDRWAPNYDFLLTSVFYQAVHKRLIEYVELPEQPNVLDLGCGTGRLLNRLATEFPTLQGTGLDLSAEMLHQARQRNRHGIRLIYKQGNAESLPFAESQFDAVFNTLSFLHYPKPQQVVLEVSRVLRPGGHFYLVDPSIRESADINYFPFTPGGIQIYTPQQREQFGVTAGLECLGHHHLLGGVLLTVFSKVVSKSKH
jgi:ubiquinone/menaquinone biosynthesis C-methylase UbiE